MPSSELLIVFSCPCRRNEKEAFFRPCGGGDHDASSAALEAVKLAAGGSPEGFQPTTSLRTRCGGFSRRALTVIERPSPTFSRIVTMAHNAASAAPHRCAANAAVKTALHRHPRVPAACRVPAGQDKLKPQNGGRETGGPRRRRERQPGIGRRNPPATHARLVARLFTFVRISTMSAGFEMCA